MDDQELDIEYDFILMILIIEEKQMEYKREEIKEYFDDFIKDQGEEWIEENIDDLHYHAFNTDYYIYSRYLAKAKWLGGATFDVIEHIKRV